MSDLTAREKLEQAEVLAGAEIYRRLSENPEKIPDHVLSRYAMELGKILDRQEQKEVEEHEGEEFSLLDQIQGLPPERAESLLKEHIARLKKELKKYEEALLDNSHRLGDEPGGNTGWVADRASLSSMS